MLIWKQCRNVKHIGQSGFKEVNRRKITKRPHRYRIRAAKMGFELSGEIMERVEAVVGIESLLILAVAALDLTIVARGIWSDQLMADTHI